MAAETPRLSGGKLSGGKDDWLRRIEHVLIISPRDHCVQHFCGQHSAAGDPEGHFFRPADGHFGDGRM
jgi:hypothetical protein